LNAGIALVRLTGMTLDEIYAQIKTCADAMTARHGGVVLSEWAAVSRDTKFISQA
jgi:hypothetical protein